MEMHIQYARDVQRANQLKGKKIDGRWIFNTGWGVWAYEPNAQNIVVIWENGERECMDLDKPTLANAKKKIFEWRD